MWGITQVQLLVPYPYLSVPHSLFNIIPHAWGHFRCLILKEVFPEDDINANMNSKSSSAGRQKAFEKSFPVIYLPNKWPLQHNMSVEWIISLQHSLEMDLSKKYQGFSISQVNERENKSREWTLPQGTQWKWKRRKSKDGGDLLFQLSPFFGSYYFSCCQNYFRNFQCADWDEC